MLWFDRNRVKQLAKMFPNVRHPRKAPQQYRSSILSREVVEQAPLADHLVHQMTALVGHRHFAEIIDMGGKGKIRPQNADLHVMRRQAHNSETNWVI